MMPEVFRSRRFTTEGRKDSKSESEMTPFLLARKTTHSFTETSNCVAFCERMPAGFRKIQTSLSS